MLEKKHSEMNNTYMFSLILIAFKVNLSPSFKNSHQIILLKGSNTEN